MNSLKNTDVLFILDCCCAMSMVQSKLNYDTTHEILASSGTNQACPVRTFTPAFCSVLSIAPEKMFKGFSNTPTHCSRIQSSNHSYTHDYTRQ